MPGLLPVEMADFATGDLFRGLAAAFKPSLPNPLISLPGLGEGFSVRSGRSAIVIALKALGMKSGSRIGVPLYCCPVVFKSIREAGGVPVFLDIEPGTFCLSPDDVSAKESLLDALIIVHMFGNVPDMNRLRQIMKDKPILEDCAQSLGSRYGGQAIGSFGKISVFSFRLGKYISAGEGGALFACDPDIRNRLAHELSQASTPTFQDELNHVFAVYLRSKLRGRRLWGPVGSRIWERYNRKTDFLSRSPIAHGRIYKSDLDTVGRRLNSLLYQIEAQRSHASYFLKHLRLDATMLCHEHPGEYWNRYLFPILFFSSKQRDDMATHLRRHRIGTISPYIDSPSGAMEHYGYRGDCPVTETIAQRILAIPCHNRLKPYDLTNIVRQVNQGWINIRKTAK